MLCYTILIYYIIFYHVTSSLALGRLHAAEREVLHAELVVGHLVVVVEPFLVRSG